MIKPNRKYSKDINKSCVVIVDKDGRDCHGNSVCVYTFSPSGEFSLYNMVHLVPKEYDENGDVKFYTAVINFSETLKRIKISLANWTNAVARIAPENGVIRWILASYRSKRRKREECQICVSNCSFSYPLEVA